MIRKLKVLLLAAMALTAFAALGAAGAHAAEEKFHCSVAPCRVRVTTDGASGTATAHQVLVISDTEANSVSYTCAGITGEGNSATKIAIEFTLQNIVYDRSCKALGQEVDVRMNGCHYLFTSTRCPDEHGRGNPHQMPRHAAHRHRSIKQHCHYSLHP